MFIPVRHFLSWTLFITMGMGMIGSRPALAAAPAAKPLDFNRDIRPILSDNCFGCHGPDEKNRKAKLRLDQRESATALREGGKPAIAPKNPEGSELWHRIITTDEDDLMPPAESNKKLTPVQMELLKRWIAEGAEYKGHWAFEPPQKAVPPAIKDKKWARNEVDNFIAAALAEKKLVPEKEATKEQLVRRVTLDLTGLPPTPEEVDAFLDDKKAGAYERLVDRLLQSPRYGEHQARYWLDAVRYGDTHGLHLDNERSMWPYRDWVVRAYNENLPFDQFTLWQIAGDLLPKATTDQKIASGYNRCNVTTSEGGAIEDEFYVRYAVDRTETTSVNWMGLTAGCAVCHDHKFDPISQKEFYSLYSFFNNNNEKAMDGNALLTPPTLKLPTAEEERQLTNFDAKLAALKKEIAEETKKIKYEDKGPKKLERVEAPREVVWVEDAFPDGAQAQKNGDTPDLQWVGLASGHFYSGSKALKRTATGVAQDYFTVATPLLLERSNTLFAYVYLEPKDPPKAIMLQFYTTDWLYRANWGDEDIIPYGEKGKEQKMLMGPLPETGKWVRLEIPTEKLNMKSGLRIRGMSFAQFGGTVYWDKAGVVTELEQKDWSGQSQWAWEVHAKAENLVGVPAEVAKVIKEKAADRDEQEKKLVRDYYVQNIYDGTREAMAPLKQKQGEAQKGRDALFDKIPGTLVTEEMEKPRGAFVLKRGAYDDRGEQVLPGVPKFLPSLAPSGTTNRLDLARWLVSPSHPLTSRVIVNRYWQQFFGTGLVKTAQDFGSQGEWPSNPALLDWLAVHFMESGWDVKQFHRLLVTSAAYRQDTRVTPEKLEADPENRLVSRGPRFRLDGEVIRDTALYAGGILVEKTGGRGVRTYQPPGIWEAVGYTSSNTAKYQQDAGDALYRRSLYLFWKRTAPPPVLMTFDAPSRENYCVRRERSDTPLQALVTMNDTQFVEAARHFGERIMAADDSLDKRLDFGFRTVTARHPSSAEKNVLKSVLQKHLATYAADKAAAEKLIAVGDSPANKTLDPSELAAYTMVASLLLNLDESLNKN